MVFTYYCVRRNEESGLAWPSLSTIAADLGMPKTYVCEMRRKLIEKGWIEIVSGDTVRPLMGFKKPDESEKPNAPSFGNSEQDSEKPNDSVQENRTSFGNSEQDSEFPIRKNRTAFGNPEQDSEFPNRKGDQHSEIQNDHSEFPNEAFGNSELHNRNNQPMEPTHGTNPEEKNKRSQTPVEIYEKYFDRKLSIYQIEQLRVVSDLAVWEETVSDWRTDEYSARSLSRMIKVYKQNLIRPQFNANGNHKNGAYVGAAQPSVKPPEVFEDLPRPRRERSGQWGEVLNLLDASIGADHVQTWFEPLDFLGCDDGALRLVAPDLFYSEFIQSNYAAQFRDAIVTVFGDESAVNFQPRHTEV